MPPTQTGPPHSVYVSVHMSKNNRQAASQFWVGAVRHFRKLRQLAHSAHVSPRTTPETSPKRMARCLNDSMRCCYKPRLHGSFWGGLRVCTSSSYIPSQKHPVAEQ